MIITFRTDNYYFITFILNKSGIIIVNITKYYIFVH